jgi:carotenoid cleavage dioxygenase
VTEATAANATQFAPLPDGSMAQEGLNPVLRRWTIDLAGTSETVSEEVLDDLACEFPRTDDRYMTIKNRHHYVAFSRGDFGMFSGLAHYDRQTGARQEYEPGPQYFVGEPVVVPRSGGDDEADGYVLALAHNSETDLTELLVLDAASLAKGPLATVKLPVRIPAGFHGTWVEGDA